MLQLVKLWGEGVALLLVLLLPLSVLVAVAGLTGFRIRLADLMGPKARRDEFPHGGRSSAAMGYLVVWTGEYRQYPDRWLVRFVWTSRLAMIAAGCGVVALVLSDLLR